MDMALDLARSHDGKTGPNPSVGCIIVKEGEIVGRGVTAEGGRPHAETEALLQAGGEACGATIYVTLEPCSHYGQTAPCANALIDAQIKKCVIATIDRDPRVHWRGAAILQEAGIDTIIGVRGDLARNLYLHFFLRFE